MGRRGCGARGSPHDNRNRTASEVRHLFAKHGGNLGTTGTVAWQFERKGVVLVLADGVDEDALVLVVAEAGAEDVELDGSSFVVTSTPETMSAVRGAVEAAGFTIESVELAMVPKVSVAVADEGVARQVIRLVEGLEDTDDVRTSTRTSTSRSGTRSCSSLARLLW
jgi:transcriptional/translational regulatory protein YebC/TACO1